MGSPTLAIRPVVSVNDKCWSEQLGDAFLNVQGDRLVTSDQLFTIAQYLDTEGASKRAFCPIFISAELAKFESQQISPRIKILFKESPRSTHSRNRPLLLPLNRHWLMQGCRIRFENSRTTSP